ENKISDKNQITYTTSIRDFPQEQKNKFRFFLVTSIEDADFKDLCGNYPEDNCHLLEKGNNEFIWKKSRGSLGNLRKYVDVTEQGVTESAEDDLIKPNEKFTIISAEPGMGKSTVLT